MGEERYALVCDDAGGELAQVALRLLRLGIDTLYASGGDEAWLLATQEAAAIRAVLFPPSLGLDQLVRVSERLESSPGGRAPTLVAVGARPGAERLSALRGAGVCWAVWNPDDDSALRFVVNAALARTSEMVARSDPRVPTTLLGTFRIGESRRDAVVSSLSARGAFLETPSPLEKDAMIELEVWLPEGILQTRARVVHANRPGESREARWPLGMSVVFEELVREEAEMLQRYVEQLVGQFRL